MTRLRRHVASKLDILAPMMAVAAPTPRNKIRGNGIVDGLYFSRTGIADGRHGQSPVRAPSRRRAGCSRKSTAPWGNPEPGDLRRPGSGIDAYRKRAARDHGRLARRGARARGGGRPGSASEAEFVAGHARRILRALRRRRVLARRTPRLLRLRGRAMQAAVPVGAGAMAALLGAELAAARSRTTRRRDGEVCPVANDNGGGQVVPCRAPSRRRARHRRRQGARGQARRAAARLRAVPLRADAARRRRDGEAPRDAAIQTPARRWWPMSPRRP